jgi:hypothetical protein
MGPKAEVRRMTITTVRISFLDLADIGNDESRIPTQSSLFVICILGTTNLVFRSQCGEQLRDAR